MKNWKCRKCGVSLIKKKTVFDYLGRTFTAEIDRCPHCGQVLIPAELAQGKMAEAESIMEDK